jgi:sugar phosphate permease
VPSGGKPLDRQLSCQIKNGGMFRALRIQHPGWPRRPLLLSSLLIVSVSWRGAFIVVGIAGLAFMLIWLWYFRDDPKDHPSIAAEELSSLESPERLTRHIPYAALMRRFLPLVFVYFCYGWTLWIYLNWLPSFFQQSYHLNLKNSALFSSGIFLKGLLATFSAVLSATTFTRERAGGCSPAVT